MGPKKQEPPKPPDATPQVSAEGWNDVSRRVRRKFNGPPGADEPLRVDIERRPLADVMAHASEQLDAEVCGILAGEACVDDEGPFVHVVAAVRAPATRQGRAHVTFTQETWDAVHAAMERDHPGLAIVGWYHSHPGFGVEFSDMDAFIQQNFFGPTQVALVYDPLAGSLGACTGSKEGLRGIGRIWVAGRERRCETGARREHAATADVAAMESRLLQVVEALDEMRASLRRFLTVVATALALVLTTLVASWIVRTFVMHRGGPQLVQAIPLRATVDGHDMIIDLAVVLDWQEMKDAPGPAPEAASAPGGGTP